VLLCASLRHCVMEPDSNGTPSNEPHEHQQPDGQPAIDPSLAAQPIKGRYALVKELGRGGFGVAYLAHDLKLASRKVVVKCLRRERAGDAWSLRKFHGEMEALARIDHPGVVAVIDCGELDNGIPYLVEQYVPGEPLRDLIPRGGISLARAAEIVRQIGRALSAVHQVGVCHRDLKPENVIVQTNASGEDQVKVIDFGVASVADLPTTPPSTLLAGTLQYMAPEQFDRKSSPSTDIYQLGEIAYELITGVAPFRSSRLADLVMEKTRPVKPRPRDLRPELSETADLAIGKALAPDPVERFASAREFGDALASAVHGSGERAASLASTKTTPVWRNWDRTRSLRWLTAAGAIAVVVTLTTITTRSSFVPTQPMSVAVLPFENRLGDPDVQYLSEGITESLISDLSRIPGLRVIARGSVLRYEGKKIDPLDAGRQLHVDRIVRGSVSRRAEELRIEAELMDVRSGTHLWGSSYKGAPSALSDRLERISTEITDQLRLKLSGPLKERLVRQYATGSESYQLYLQGRFHLNKRTAEDFEAAIRSFEQSIAKDPAYAPAHAGLAYTYAQLALNASLFGTATPARALGKAKASALRALELDGTLAEAYTALAFVQMQAEYDWDAAEKTFQRAIELNPNWADARECYALELTALGRFDEALRQILLAEALEPEARPLRAAHATILYFARRFDESLALADRIAKETGGAHILGDLVAQSYWAKGMPLEALAAAQQIPASYTPHLRTPMLIAAYARAKQEHMAVMLLHNYEVRPETALWYFLALAHLALGDRAQAVRDLENDYERRSAEVPFIAVDPGMDALRGDGRFRKLLANMKLGSTSR
jgi:eukaryotic-like serine/threonine-protein kinase